MPNWIPITVADLNDAKVAALVTALRTAALAEGQTDPSPRRIQSVVDNIRRKIASNQGNQLDADPTRIPASLKDMATAFIIAELKGRLEEPLTQDEVRAIERHVIDLNRIAVGTDAIEQPDDAIEAPVQETSGSPTITTGRRESRNGLRDGL